MSSRRVLVVEDDPDLRELVADDFSIEGWSVDQAENGCVAVEMLLKKEYCCVFSDMKMPKGDGRFLAQKVLELEGHKPLMFICSGYNEMSEQEVKDLGIKEVFNKPMTMSKVILSIEAHLARA